MKGDGQVGIFMWIIPARAVVLLYWWLVEPRQEREKMTSRRPAKTNNESNQSATPLEVSQSNPSPSTASPAPPCEPENHISHGISTIKRAAHPAMSRWLSLSSTQRYAAAAILFPFIVFPTIWLLFLSPGIAFFFVVTYSVLFGFWTFIAHFEAALQEHFALSPEVKLYFISSPPSNYVQFL